MKFNLFLNSEEEHLDLHVKNKNSFVEDISNLVDNYNSIIDGKNIFGYLQDDIVPISLSDVNRFFVQDNKTMISTNGKIYKSKYRLYQIEEILNDEFIKINQSCIINKRKIKKFSVSWNGSLSVELISGEIDYISRRQLKIVKERMGLKNE